MQWSEILGLSVGSLAFVERNARLNPIKSVELTGSSPRLPQYHATEPGAARGRLRRLPRETFDFLGDKRSVRAVHLQEALGFTVLYDLSPFQEGDPIEIAQR
jgi:hypothetical protein